VHIRRYAWVVCGVCSISRLQLVDVVVIAQSWFI